MRNQKKNRIQDSIEYQMVKQITSEENRKNIIEAAKAFSILLAALFVSIWAFSNFLLNLENIILWYNDLNFVTFIIDIMIWLKEITS
mgnify:CR=1 FL=1|tara:strand:+ start:489 stop:749 length:261 start_codon:yes stop_codon:yes gene_type:complete